MTQTHDTSDADNPLTQLLYVSHNSMTCPSLTLRDEINSILEVAQTRNAALGVTGLLTFNRGIFCQVLEGPEDVVEDLFETIQMDARHDEVVVLDIAPIERRTFEDWSMGFVGNDPELDKLFNDLDLKSLQKMEQGDGQSIYALMAHLALKHEADDRAA